MADEALDRGQVLLEWTFPEFERHDRSRGWYIVTTLFLLVSIALSVLTKDYTFAALVVLFAMILLFRIRRPPLDVRVAIRDEGLEVGQRYFSWNELKEFWILYQPPKVKKVYFHFKSAVRPAIDIALGEQNPIKLRQLLSERLPENTQREEEPTGDQVTRFLKI